MRPLTQFALVVAACLLAATTAEAQTTNACVMKNGLMKVVDDESDCGPQETPISLGQPQPAVETARVFDGEGREIGIFVGAQNPAAWRVLLTDLGVIAPISPHGMRPNHPAIRNPDIIFGLANCEGPRYVGTHWSNTLFPDPQSSDVWLVGTTNRYWAIPVASVLKPNGQCEEADPNPRAWVTAATVPVEEFNEDLGDIFSRPLPLWIGSSSSVSP
jgi:hypothetical protein